MTTKYIQQAKQRYNLRYWSEEYFDIDDTGDVIASLPPSAKAEGSYNNQNTPKDNNEPKLKMDHTLHLPTLIQQLKAQGITPPMLLRFNDILHHRIQYLQQAFTHAIQETGYANQYTAVYPIKVNQQQHVVQQIATHPGMGLEAGSKAELIAILATAPQTNTLIVCNGYKDPAYLHLALMGQQLGHEVIIILEKLDELDRVLQQAARLNVIPTLGVRVRLASIAKGRWQNTGGAKSKFGLTAAQLITLITRLKEASLLSQLQCLHCHLGSQIANIRDIQHGMQECAQFFAELIKLGVPIHTVDVGGGLGVDYEGTRSRHFCSMNYTVAEYAKHIVHALHDVCQQQNLPAPRIVTESGRALTAHHAVLITEVVARDTQPSNSIQAPTPQAHRVLHDLWHLWQHLDTLSPIEGYHEVCHALEETHSLYALQLLSLTERAQAEDLYTQICTKLLTLLSRERRAERDIIEHLQQSFAQKIFCNFSIFRSLPDIWAIQQIFPILPLTHCNQPLDEHVVLHDLTCDSDGRIDLYVDGQGLGTHLVLPQVPADQPLYLGVFLVGAYQEILGDNHNLFGNTHAVQVSIQADGSYQCSHHQPGDTLADVLSTVHFKPTTILDKLQAQLQQSSLDSTKQAELLNALTTLLQEYTYLT